MTSPFQIRRVIGDVTILVNNAGVMPCKPFTKHSQHDIESLFATNVFSQFWVRLPTSVLRHVTSYNKRYRDGLLDQFQVLILAVM